MDSKCMIAVVARDPTLKSKLPDGFFPSFLMGNYSTEGIPDEVFVLIECMDSSSSTDGNNNGASLFLDKIQTFVDEQLSGAVVMDAILSQQATQEKVDDVCTYVGVIDITT